MVLFEWDSLENTGRRLESATLSRKFDEAGEDELSFERP